jgi:hypothetical protein
VATWLQIDYGIVLEVEVNVAKVGERVGEEPACKDRGLG